MLILSLFFLLITFSFSQVPQELIKFFQREGYVVKREGNSVIIDLPKGKAFPGERFEVITKGEPIVHPVTKKVLGYEEKKTGEVEVTEPKENYSYAKIVEDMGIKEGDKVRLITGTVCYEGSDEGFYALSGIVKNLKRGIDNCTYLVKELENGYGVSYLGRPIAFFPVERKIYAEKEKYPEDFVVKARYVRSLGYLPLSADICKLFGKKDYLVVLYESGIKVYEVLKSDFVEVNSYALPPGYPVGVVCYEKHIFVNVITNGRASSVMLKPIGDSFILVEKDIPYIFGYLLKKGKKVLVGQEFNERDYWGEVYRFELRGDKLIKSDRLNLPEDFRIDGALVLDDLLIFVDSDRRLRIYYRGNEVLSEDGFGASYTTAELPEEYSYADGNKYIFYAKPSFTEVFRKVIPLIPKNKSSAVFSIVGFTKFIEGELWGVIEKKKGVFEAVKLRGRKFEEAIQAVVRDSEGRVFVITGRKGTLPIQNRGDIYLVELRPL
ncbi:hypothetical protein JCM9492_01700 [Aquifex pyrophilus]